MAKKIREKLNNLLGDRSVSSALRTLICSAIIFLVVVAVRIYSFLHKHGSEIVAGIIGSLIATVLWWLFTR